VEEFEKDCSIFGADPLMVEIGEAAAVSFKVEGVCAKAIPILLLEVIKTVTAIIIMIIVPQIREIATFCIMGFVTIAMLYILK
jgi:predicted exporter